MASKCKQISLIVLAIAEMIALAVAVGTVSFFVHEGQSTVGSVNAYEIAFDLGFYGRHEFFLFATGVVFFIAIFSMVIAFASYHEKARWAVMMATLHAFGALTLLISASLLAKTTMTYDKEFGFQKVSVCKALKEGSTDARCYQLTIGVAFGFVSTVLFIGDTAIYIAALAQNIGISFVNMDNIGS